MNKATPFFSVILHVYNSADMLNMAIVSILTKTFSDYELLIMESAIANNNIVIVRACEKFDKVCALSIYNVESALSAWRQFVHAQQKSAYSGCVCFAPVRDTASLLCAR